MAQYLLAHIGIHEPPIGSSYSASDFLDIYYDDSSETIVVFKNGVSFAGGSSAEIGFRHQNYEIVYGLSSYVFTDGAAYGVSGYSFCSGTTLVWFKILLSNPTFPHFQQVTTENSPVCDTGGGAVCDIIFTKPFAITNCTTQTSNDGQVIAEASSSNGTIKYSLADFTYSTGGQTSGTFTGLSPGTYTLYAKDANDCTAQREFTVLFQPEEVEHYRFTWDALNIGGGNARTSRVRIYEREYIGDLVEIDNGTTSPFVLNKPKQGGINDKFYPIHPTNAVLSLVSKVDYQYLPLYTNDNKKYRVVYEVDTGGGFEAKWTGFIIPSVYRELFIASPYPVELQVADNLKDLENEPFTDDNGNLLNGNQKLIAVIAQILQKTGLKLNIRSGINIFETNHNTTATDDPLDQTYIDVACYRTEDGIPFSCYEVLEAILAPFGARIYQYDNQWIIEEINRAITTYAYRIFTYQGVYSSNSTFNPIVDIKAPSESDRVALVEGNHSMEIIPAYGKISLHSYLNYIGSFPSGKFEKEDLLSPESEQFSTSSGIFTTEEGFKDWTLRLNGTSGVSFGRAVIADSFKERNPITKRVNRASQSTIDVIRDIDEPEKDRSVGAFYFGYGAFSGNLRDAYVESALKPYQYGAGDSLGLSFDYLAGGVYSYPFMVLRFMLKLGDLYLQNDLTWGETENIYRNYPQPATSIQKFELSIAVPETEELVDSTLQLRIYFYAKDFYDFGLPSGTSDPEDGTDGITSFKALSTEDIDYDYRSDVRFQFKPASKAYIQRRFYELRISTQEESNEVLHPDDFDATNNPKIFYLIATVNEENKTLANSGSRSKKSNVFYIDNVSIDALINGQSPPTEETIELEISKYINENLEIQLYNFDLPEINNAKNMYNNYFRLSDGTPTASWARSGVDESLTLQQIFLKVLGANHSAPTFRLTGSFINEFSIVGINNYLRLTKPGSALSLSNTEFTSDLASWSQTGAGTTFTWTADNDGSAQVVLSGSNSSQKLYQAVSHSGGYITITVNIHVIPPIDNNREDVLWVVFYNGASIIHMEKMRTFAAPTSDSDYDFTYVAFAPGSVTRIGFFIANVAGTSEVTYQVGEFTPEGTDIQEVYQIADYSFNDFNHSYTFELMQLSKSYISLQGTDQGGSNQGGGGNTPGSSFSGAYSTAYGGDFDTVLN